MGVYKVFGSNNLTLLFYNVYLCFICDLRRDSSKRKYWNVHIWNCSSSFLLDITNKFCVIISKRLYYTSLKLNCNFSKGCVPLSPTEVTEGCTVLPRLPVALFICQFMLSVDFFSFLAIALGILSSQCCPNIWGSIAQEYMCNVGPKRMVIFLMKNQLMLHICLVACFLSRYNITEQS